MKSNVVDLKTGFKRLENGNYVGYKVMGHFDGKVVSGADSRLSFPLFEGGIIMMGGQGVFISPTKDYVMDYYSGLSPEEVLLEVEFDRGNILFGKESFNDKEPEIGVSSVIVRGFERIEDPDQDQAVKMR